LLDTLFSEKGSAISSTGGVVLVLVLMSDELSSSDRMIRDDKSGKKSARRVIKRRVKRFTG